MKLLKCEVCGSNELIKDGGLFVCQYCGAKYTVEEARSLFEDGIRVKVDTSEKLKNLYILARRARKDNNTVDAAKYYEQIRVEDPNSWEAAFYSVYYVAMNCEPDEINSAAKSVSNCVNSVSDLVLDYVPEDEKSAAYEEFLNDAARIGKMFFDAAVSSLASFPYDSPDVQWFNVIAVNSINTILYAGLAAEDKFDDGFLAKEIYDQAFKALRDAKKVYQPQFLLRDTMTRLEKNVDEHVNRATRKLPEAQRKRNIKYWEKRTEEKHGFEEEKKRLLAERDQLQDEINVLNIKKSSVPALEELNSLRGKMEDLRKKKSALGLFKISERKAVQAEINVVGDQIDIANKTVALQQEEFNREISYANDRVRDIDKRTKKIDWELTRDR